MSDWTRGDDPVYDGYRENWKAQSEADCEAECAEEEERHDIVLGILTARLRELAEAERDGRVVVLNEIFRTPIGQYGFIYYDKRGLMSGYFFDTKEEAESAFSLELAAADAGNATEPKGEPHD